MPAGRGTFSAYAEALPLLARTPALFLAPLFTGVLDVLVQELISRSGASESLGGMTGGIAQMLIFLIDSFGLCVSLIIADRVWRRGRATFDEGWEEARRRAADIFVAALGLNFVVYVGLQIGSLIGNGYVGLGLYALAFFFLIYTLPAAAIGGMPGMATLNASVERVRADIPKALGLAVCFILTYWVIGTLLVPLYTSELGIGSLLISALVRAIALGYFSLVLARAYESTQYRPY